MLKITVVLFATVGVISTFVIRDAKRDTNFGSFDPNALYNQMSQQSQQFLSQGGTSSSSGGSTQTGSDGTGSGSAGSASGGFDPNTLYQQQSQQMQQYMSSHQTGSSSGSGSQSSSGTSGSSAGGSGSGSGSTGSSSGSGSTGSSSSTGSGSFDPNALYHQQSQQNLQKLDASLQNTNSNFNANTLNKMQASLTDPSSAQLGASNGGGSGFDPDQYNTMKFNFYNPEQGGQSSSGGQSQGGQTSGGQTAGGQTSGGQTAGGQTSKATK